MRNARDWAARFICFGLLFALAPISGAGAELVEVSGRWPEVSFEARVLFGEAPSSYDRALYLLRSELPAAHSAVRPAADGTFVVRFSKRARNPWLAVEANGNLLIEAQLESRPAGQALPLVKLPEIAPLRATILGAEGAPLAGALVWLESIESPLPLPWKLSLRKTLSAEDGSFELAQFSGETVFLHVNAAGYPPSRFEVHAKASPVPLRFTLTRGGVNGRLRVLANEREPVPDVLVALADGEPVGFTDRAGYCLYAIKPGVKLVLSTSGGLNWEVEPLPGETRTYLGGRILVRGKVVDLEGESLAGAEVEARPKLLLAKPLTSMSQKDGTFGIGPLSLTDWDLLVRAEGHADRVVPLAHESFDAAEAAEIELGALQLESETTLSGWVSSAVGPLEGAAIYVLRGEAMTRQPRLDPPPIAATAFSAADGSFTLRGLRADETVGLEARAPGFAPSLKERIEVQAGDQLDILLDEASRLEVLASFNEAPLHYATVGIELEADDGSGFKFYGRRETDENGEVFFEDLPRRRVRIEADYSDLRPAQLVVELTEAEERVALQLGFGTALEILVKGNNGLVLQNASAALLSENREYLTSVEPDGYFRWRGLAPGRAEVQASAEGHEARKMALDLPVEGTLRSEISLAPYRNELRGVVLSSKGKIVRGANIFLVREHELQPGGVVQVTREQTTSAADGSFRFDHLGPETYILQVWPNEPYLEKTSMPIFMGKPLEQIEVVLQEIPGAGG